MTDENHAEQLPEAKLVELESSFIDGDNRDLADDEEIFFPLYVGELRELLRGYRVQRAFAAREADLVGAETHRIGDRVKIIAPDWEHEPPHYITGIDWHPKHGITYTTSEVWPPKVEGFHVCGLTDEWLPENLAALKSREASHG